MRIESEELIGEMKNWPNSGDSRSLYAIAVAIIYLADALHAQNEKKSLEGEKHVRFDAKEDS